MKATILAFLGDYRSGYYYFYYYYYSYYYSRRAVAGKKNEIK